MRLWSFKKKEPVEKTPVEKRATLTAADFVPLNESLSGGPQPRAVLELSQVRRALGHYSNLLNNSELFAMKKGEKLKEHYLVDMLNRGPNRWETKSEFFTNLVQQYWCFGGFFARIFETGGKVTGLGSYNANTIFTYGKNKSMDGSDPAVLQAQGFYYLSSYEDESGGKMEQKIPESEIWRVTNPWSKAFDQLNGRPMAEAFPSVVNFAFSILETSESFSESGLVSPSLISGLAEAKPEQKQDIRKALNEFFKSKDRNWLTLDDKITLQSLIMNNPATMIEALNSVASVGIARLFDLPVQLIDAENFHTTQGGNEMREQHRHWTRNSGKAFLNRIGEALSQLCEPETQIKFAWRSSLPSDLREAGTALPPLVEGGLLSPERAKEFLD